MDRRTFQKHFALIPALFGNDKDWPAGEAEKIDTLPLPPKLLADHLWGECSGEAVCVSNLRLCPHPWEYETELSEGLWHFGIFDGQQADTYAKTFGQGSNYPVVVDYVSDKYISGNLLLYNVVSFVPSPNKSSAVYTLSSPVSSLVIRSGTPSHFRISQIKPEKRWIEGVVGSSLKLSRTTFTEGETIPLDEFMIREEGSIVAKSREDCPEDERFSVFLNSLNGVDDEYFGYFPEARDEAFQKWVAGEGWKKRVHYYR